MIKSTHDFPLYSILVGWSVSWVKLLDSINSSSATPIGESISSNQNCLERQFRSPVRITQCGLASLIIPKISDLYMFVYRVVLVYLYIYICLYIE